MGYKLFDLEKDGTYRCSITTVDGVSSVLTEEGVSDPAAIQVGDTMYVAGSALVVSAIWSNSNPKPKTALGLRSSNSRIGGV